MSRQVRFTDLFGMPERSNIFSDAANLLEDFYGSNNSPAFRVAIRATHAGYLLNNRVYPGKGVKAGAPSWVSKDNGGTAGYDKPFLKHHDSKSEPIGRIDAQKFVQLWDDDKFANDWKHKEIPIACFHQDWQPIQEGSGCALLHPARARHSAH